MDMDIPVLVLLRIDGQTGLNQGKGNLGRFLHDVAELAGQNQLAASGHVRCFDEENLAAHLGPGQTRDDSGRIGGLDLVVEVGLPFEKFREVVFFHLNGESRLSGHLVGSRMAGNLLDPLL